MLLEYLISSPADGREPYYEGSISGIVTDENFCPLIGATVIAFYENDSSFGAMTDISGCYMIKLLSPGTYTVITSMVGMNPDTLPDISLGEDESITLDFALDPDRLVPVHPMIDTVFTDEICNTEWISSIYRNWVGNTDSLQIFSEVNDIDWYSHPGELRLELDEHLIVDTCSNFRALQSLDLDRDGFLDLIGIARGSGGKIVTAIPYSSPRTVTINRGYFLYNDPSFPDGWRVETRRYIWPIRSIGTVDNASVNGVTIIFGVNPDGFIVAANMPHHIGGESLGDHRFRIVNTDYASSLYSVDATDFDGDGVLEFVAVDKEHNRVMIFQRHRRDRDFTLYFNRIPQARGNIDIMYNPYWEMELITDEIISPHTVLVRDLNNDGSIDIIVASEEGNALTWFSCSSPEPGDSTASWRMHIIQDSTFCPSTVAIADINGDGYLDIVSAGDSIVYWLNTGLPLNIWVRGTIIPSYYHAKRIACSDVDEDGDIDLLASGEDGFSWFANNGREPSGWSEILIDGVPEGGYQATETIDMNRDGNLDFVSLVSRQIKWWQNRISSEGRLVSKIIRLGGVPFEAEIEWISSATGMSFFADHTSVSFRVRSSFNPREMGEWSEEIRSPGDLMPYLNENTRLIQYEAILRTDLPIYSPVLHELRIEYSYPDSVPDYSHTLLF